MKTDYMHISAAELDALRALNTELLEALEQLMDYCDSATKPEWARDEAYAQARTTIAKAKGG
jgi:hypothetical protein